MDPVESYIHELAEIRASWAGTPEQSLYPALASLLNTEGRKLNPRVRCIMHPRGLGAGLPDGGFYTPDQFARSSDAHPIDPPNPSRGVIEAKPLDDDAWVTAEIKQVSRYWKRYRQVLVTNFRDFLLLGADDAGQPKIVESYRLAESEAAFWVAARNPHQFAASAGPGLVEFLKRVMLHAAPLTAPRDLAWFLASYAREAKYRIERAETPGLTSVREALENALGLTFQGEQGDQFFRSTLVQTLFYGIFSAWVLWSKEHPPGSDVRFNWKEAGWYLRVPVISALFTQIAAPQYLHSLSLVDVLDLTGATLNRVDRQAFFMAFEEGQAVQYFYEPFLKAYDPTLRDQLGVWYTPPEIVQYMVARVDAVLREELGIEDGLADERVYVLDPCCGTGTYLVEVLQRIATTLRERGDDALFGYELKRAATGRIFGFEILPAPFVVAHLQMGLLLQNVGSPLTDGVGERAAVYLTNALTGWAGDAKLRLPFPEFEQERDAAEYVKRETPILVVLGNPPYNGYAGVVESDEERALTQAYKTTHHAPAPQGQGLNDLYVRFFRMAERRIAALLLLGPALDANYREFHQLNASHE